MSETWADLNYVLCGGVGGTGSGRISVLAELDERENGLAITSLSLRTSYSRSHQSTATMSYTRGNGDAGEVHLQKPWFPTVLPLHDGSLVLPRVRTDASGPNPDEQGEVVVAPGSSLKFDVSLLFQFASGACPASFSGEIVMPEDL